MDSAQAEIFANSLEGKIIGGWTAGKKIGAGKSAVVLSAIKNGRAGALKVFHPELVERYGEQTQLDRIDRERSLIGVKHPNIVEILDGGKCECTHHLFVVMEYLAFKNLREVLLKIPSEKIRTIIEQITNAARFLEERGLAHRDIKPENIGISDDFKEIVLFDLGVLRPFGEADLTDVDQRAFIGTLRYSSPEFLQRKEVDSESGWRAVTIYQIGAVLHDLLMRRELFRDQSNPFAILVQAVLEKDPEIFGDDVELVRLATHCLIKDPLTRLELVSWSSFVVKDDKSMRVEDLKAKIQSRQKFFNRRTENEVIGGETARIRKRLLTDFCNNVTSGVGVILNSSQYFPFRKTILDVVNEKSVGSLSIIFEKNKNLGLSAHLSVGFEIEHRDDNNGRPIYSIRAGCALSESEIENVRFARMKDLFTGEADDLLSSATLEDYLLGALEEAYEYFEAHGDPITGFIELSKIKADNV